MSDLGIPATRAYLQAAGNMTAQKPAEMGLEGVGFGDILGNAAASMAKAGATAETAVTNAALGRADLVDVVTAVAAAESTLETVIAVRDEVIKAYQDIMRMPI
jgi:flagellar hook-basal body complex protein FliE